MINYGLLLLSSTCIGLKNVFAKKSNQYIDEKHNIYTYNFYMFLIAFVISLVIGFRALFHLQLYTVFMAVLYAVFLISAQVLLIKATELGGISVSSLIYSCGFLVPTFASVFLYNETISGIQVLGILLIVLSFAITVEKGGKANLKWFLTAIVAMLCNGTVGLIQKIFRMSEYSAEQSGLMVLAFFAGTIITGLMMPKKKPSLPSAGFLKTVTGSGISLGFTNSINLYISGVLPGVIVFSCVNGGGIVASTLLARFMERERLSRKKWLSVIIGVIAICLVAL